MPLFDLTIAKSTEVRDAHSLADRLSECDAYWDLAEVDNAIDAREKIAVADINEPLDNIQFTIEELENRFTYTRIASGDEEGMQAAMGESLTECPVEGGDLEIYIRRQARQIELNAMDGRSDVYRFFWDRVSALQHQIFERVHVVGRPRVASITRRYGPTFNTFKSAKSQGDYIWAMLTVEWGHLDIGGS